MVAPLIAGRAHAVEPADADIYIERVKPVLRRSCYACHGALKQEGGLRLDTAAAAIVGGDSGASILLGKSAESLLIERISDSDEATRMPQEGSPLSAEEIDAIRAWIDAGAEHPEETPPPDPLHHWSFVLPVRPTVPDIDGSSALAQSSNPIDRFLAAKQAQLGVTPVAEADRYMLLRRVTIDLTGLPPTRDEIDAFVSDRGADAYERLVDRLLASPAYGERWGRHWMDVWRYSDWDGFGEQVRESQPFMWRWRDWIVQSLNEDKPYDRMIVEMLAGDELAPDDPDTARATGFLARNYNLFNRNTWMENTVEHTGKAFLGLTLNCARCHDHKYDPIAQREYYEWRAAFEPYGVRTDPIPGAADTKQDGLTRVYDSQAETPTYLFVRGDEKHPDEAHPLAPTLPRILGGAPLDAKAIELPPPAWYPGVRDFEQLQRIVAAESKVAEARNALRDSTTALAKLCADSEAATPTQNSAENVDAATQLVAARDAQESAAAGLAVVEAELSRLQAVAAADRARYLANPAGDAAPLIEAAVKAERAGLLAVAEQSFLLAQQARKNAPGDSTAEALAELDKKVTEAEQARQAAKSAMENPSGDYSPSGPTYPKTSTGRRLALANAIASKQNPLTARVAVNHLWARHFGVPLVPTVFDFGHNGRPPTHPELLDWLAVELMDDGWQHKPLHRLIVTSRAYRLSSSPRNADPRNGEADRDNIALWRMNPHRLEAEAVRDAALLVSGRLNASLGGADLDPATDAQVMRRSLYFRQAKEKRVPFLAAFDQANVTECYRRAETIVPQQALAMANSELIAACAKPILSRIETRLGAEFSNDARFIDEAFLHILARPCSAEERARCSEFLAQQSAAAVPVRERLIHTLLNHHDFVTAR